MRDKIQALIKHSIQTKEALCEQKTLLAISSLVKLMIASLKKGGKIILFGNGGSASDAQHIAAELVGRFTKERKALAAIALTANSSNLTCIGNDYGFAQIFARQIEALGQVNDLAIGISTSGNSANVLKAILQAKAQGIKTAALTGQGPNKLTQAAQLVITVPSKNTARVQEAHITIGHIICELTEQAFV